jgi:hypothetical protein
MSGVDSSMQKDDELSRILYDKFNKSIISHLNIPGHVNSPRTSKKKDQDKSEYTYDRSTFGLPDDSYLVPNDRSMLRGLNLHNDHGLDESMRDDESQLLNDVSRIKDNTALQ